MSVSHKKSKIKVKDNNGCTSPLFDGSDLFQRLTAAVNSHGIHFPFFERKRHTPPIEQPIRTNDTSLDDLVDK